MRSHRGIFKYVLGIALKSVKVALADDVVLEVEIVHHDLIDEE